MKEEDITFLKNAITNKQCYNCALQKEPKECMYSKDNYTDEDRKVLFGDCEEECEFNKKEEPVSEDLEEAAWFYADKKCHLDIAVFTSDEVKKEREKMQFTWQDLYDAVMFGAKWQKSKDQSTIELAEDHAYFAGSEAMREKILREIEEAYKKGGVIEAMKIIRELKK